ncbi:MAG: chromosome partitioning protein [Actinomycetota bacterium]|nr:chromosome partitioning protein [Actinomycetota bacterium]
MIVVSVCSLKGGVGKTSVVLGLASAALHRGLSTLVVDLDPQADATTALDVPAERAGTVSQVLSSSRPRDLEQMIVPSGWAPDGGLDVLCGSSDSAALDGPHPTDRAVHRLAESLAPVEGYRLVLVDCPPSFGTLTRSGLVASRRAVIVTEPALFSVTAADRALQAIDELRRGPAQELQPLGVIVNRFRERSPEHRFRVEELTEMFGPLVLTPVIAERSALQQAQGASQPLHTWPGKAAEELAQSFDIHLSRLVRSGGKSGVRGGSSTGR